MSDATSLIRFKRVADSASLSTITPLDGEPVWDKNTGSLYIGDGTTPGGVLIETDGTGAQHLLANASEIGPNHRIVADGPGHVLITTDTNAAKMRKMLFADLDDSGLHYMASHSGDIFSIWYSRDDTRGAGYQVEPLSYASAPIGAVPIVINDPDGTGNMLSFKKVDYLDLSGNIGNHTIDSHVNSSTHSLFATDGAGSVATISFNPSTSAVLMSNGSTIIPTFRELGWSDLTGALDLSNAFSEAPRDGATLHFKLDQNKWIQNFRVRTYVDSTLGATTLNVNGANLSKISIFSKLIGTTTSSPDSVLNAAWKQRAFIFIDSTTSFTNVVNKLVIDSQDYNSTDPPAGNSIALYSRNCTNIDSQPDLELRSSGVIALSNSSITGLNYSYPRLLVGTTTTVNSSGHPYSVNGIKIDTILVTNNDSANYNTQGDEIAGLNIQSLTISQAGITAGGTTNFSGMSGYLINAQQITTAGAAYGVRVGSVTSRCNNAFGFIVSSVKSKTTDSSLRDDMYKIAVGYLAQNIYGHSTVGLQVQGLNNNSDEGDATNSSACGVFIDLADATSSYIGKNPTSHHAIYAVSGKTYLGGSLEVRGGSTFYSNVNIHDSYLLTINGTEENDSLIITNGNIRVNNGAVITSTDWTCEFLHDEISGSFGSFDASANATTSTLGFEFPKDLALMDGTDIQRISKICLSNSSGYKYYIRKISDGIDGQIITFQSTVSNTDGVNSIRFLTLDGNETSEDYNLVIPDDDRQAMYREDANYKVYPLTDRRPIQFIFKEDKTNSTMNRWICITPPPIKIDYVIS